MTLRDTIDEINEQLATIEAELEEELADGLDRLTPPDEPETVDVDEWARENTEPAIERIEDLKRTSDADAFTNVGNTIESINPEIRKLDEEIREKYG